jgi:mono/diheme cytochrome c family protein
MVIPMRAPLLLLCSLTFVQAADATLEKRAIAILERACAECHSHAAKKMKGGLALDSRAGLIEGGDTGPAIVEGDVDKSLLVKAIRYTDEDLEMPPKGKRLPAEDVATLEAWIKAGAPWAAKASNAEALTGRPARKPGKITDADRAWWSFQPLANVTPPTAGDGWAKNEVDSFIAARLKEAGLTPAPQAERATLIRRVTFTLTGLPPTPEEVAAFVADQAPDAYAKLVDRLLASPAYGEHWARHWLDLVRYADSDGFRIDHYRPDAYRYRDYVVRSLNSDKPYDRFVQEQIAGDELFPDQPEALVATGYLRHWSYEYNNRDVVTQRDNILIDITDTTADVFMGLGLGCARCHDHKFDPVGVDDYYGMAGMLRSSPSSVKLEGVGVWSTIRSVALPETPAQLAERQKAEAEHAAKIVALKAEQTRLAEENKAVVAKLSALEKAAKAKTAVPADKATPVATAPTPKPSPEQEALTKRRDELTALLKTKNDEIQHAEFFKSKTPKAYAMQDAAKPADMPIYVRGNPYATAAVVPRGALRVASWDKFPAIPAGQSGRLQLAEWIADRRNPLTARVTVNRLWQKLFGEGLVRSVDYFGDRGERPSHPELLDHLATRFMAEGWSQKRFLRGLVLSHAYRLSSANHADGLSIDPENRLFWRMNRQRLEAEAIRDSLLKVSGELATKAGGPALVLENQENTGEYKSHVNPPTYRHRRPRPSQEFERTVYLPVMRNNPTAGDKIRSFFDFVDPAGLTGQRNQTVMPTQSLFLLNNDLVRKRAGTLAKELIAAHPDEDARLESLWLRAWNRPITAEERTNARAFLQEMTPLLKKPRAPAALEAARWQELCHSLLASNAFIYRL